MILKYIYNLLVLNLYKTTSLLPDRARVVILSFSILLNKTGYAAALLKCLLYSPLQSPPSLSVTPFSLNFLSAFCSLCFLLCSGNFHCKSLIASCIFFFSFLNSCFLCHPLIYPLFLLYFSLMFTAFCLTLSSLTCTWQ